MIRLAAFFCCATLVATACSPPIQAKHVGAREARRVVASSALTTGEISRRTNNVLYEQDLVEPPAPRAQRREEPLAGDLDLDLDEPSLAAEPLSAMGDELDAPRGKDKSRDKVAEKAAEKPQEKLADKAADKAPAAKTEPRNLPPVEEVLVINVVARDPGGFKGPALLQSILESGLRFGGMVQLRDVFAEEIEAALAGKKPAKDALDAAVSRGNAMLRQFERTATK